MAFHRTETVTLRDGQLRTVEVVSAGLHVGLTRDAIVGLKYRNERPNAAVLARLLVPLLPAGEDVVTWVPTATVRRHRRGIDHAELIARHAAAAAGLRSRRLLRRVGSTRQTGGNRLHRLGGPVFTAHTGSARLRIVLVDDVTTTGSTLRRAAAALLDAGAESVLCVTVSAVP